MKISASEKVDRSKETSTVFPFSLGMSNVRLGLLMIEFPCLSDRIFKDNFSVLYPSHTLHTWIKMSVCFFHVALHVFDFPNCAS